MIAQELPAGRATLVVGSVRGLRSEGPRVLERLDAFRPSLVGLGLSPEELAGVRDYFVGTLAEPLVPLAPSETAEVRALARYGEVGLPNPTLSAVLEWGVSHDVPVRAIDPTEADYAELFAESIGYTELLRRTLRERRISRNPPRPATADEFALAWARPPGASGGSARLARAREARVAAALRAMGAPTDRVAVVVDRERFELLVDELSGRPSAGIAVARDGA